MATIRNVIVVGGSASALGVLGRVLSTLPTGFGAAVVVALHAKDDKQDHMALDLVRHWAMPASYADSGVLPRVGHIYMARHGADLIFDSEGVFTLESGLSPTLPTPSIDRLFASAAIALGSRLVGVLLSGDGNDGARGLTAIRAYGGVCVVQSPVDAILPSMPAHALTTARPHHVVLVDKLGLLLVQLVGRG